MGQEVTRVARVVLPDGTPVWARISGAAELPAPRGQLSYSDTGFAERVEAGVESLHSLVTGVARSLAEPLRAVRPDEVSVQFGIELTAKAGKVVGLLADGETKAGITVTLTWNGGPPDPNAPDPNAPDSNGPDSNAPDPNAPGPHAPDPNAAGPHTPDPSTPGANVPDPNEPGSGGPGPTGLRPDAPGPDTSDRPPEPRAGASARAPGHGGTGGAGSGGAA
ncbi:CU044_2847 family protein [Streptomyces sp. enrichment culture]|uniref:CU044_2847 family protein n=1 Tax=Streptomyces sp. enrichment culture TaxID=1795815 RepID=UPI003F5800AF